jgi:ATP-dependent DNA helicase PIF1
LWPRPITFTRDEVNNQNIQCLTWLNIPIKILAAINRGRDAKKVTEEEADNLLNRIYVCIGARVIFSTNLWADIGLVNGLIGIVIDLIWEADQDSNIILPFTILIQFDEYSGPVFPGCNAGIVPVFTELNQFNYKSAPCTQMQFPLHLTYAITIYKSQGLTLSKVVLNLAMKKHTLGLSYVAVSQVKTLQGLLFECLFDYDHFRLKETSTFKDRVLDVLVQNRQVI